MMQHSSVPSARKLQANTTQLTQKKYREKRDLVAKILDIKNTPNLRRFDPPLKNSDPNPASYDHHKATDYSR